MSKIWLSCCVLVGFAQAVSAAEEHAKPPIAVDLNVYPLLDQVSSDTDMTLVINAPLPGRLSYFSFANFRGITHSNAASFTRSEQNLRWSVSESWPVDLNAQAIFADGSGNDLLQIGLGWRVSDTRGVDEFFDKINLLYRVTFHLKRFSAGDDDAWQMEHFFRMTFPAISRRLYLSGFLDQTFDLNLPSQFPNNPVTTEIQLGWRVLDRLYAVAEYRSNDFRFGDEKNFAVGVEYKFRW